ncbi:Subtilisin-like protease SBT3 [Linum perenne]
MQHYYSTPCLLFLCFFLLLSTTVVHAKEFSTYIVHLDPSFRPKLFTTHQQWHSSIIFSIKSTTSTSSTNNPFLLYSYNNALHGFSAVLSQLQLQTLKDLPGFLSAYEDKVVTVDTTYTSDFLSLSPSTGLWPASKFGEDVIIGVIDTGVWPESASFKDDGMTKVPARWKGTCQQGNLKLIGARYFNKGVKAANPNARDTQGHGTHTSSTAAGNYVKGASYFGYAKGVARGMAPRARVAMYKVIWDEGRYASDVLAGMDQAVADGVDIISISMGFDDVPLYQDPIAIASFGAMEKGVLVSSSAGNYGPRPGLLHNGIPWVLTVAAGTVDRSLVATLTLGNERTIVGRSLFPLDAWVKDEQLIYNKTLSKCDSMELLSEAPRAIIVCDDTGFFEDQRYAISLLTNVVGAIFISDVLDINLSDSPSMVITSAESAAVISYIKSSSDPIASMKFKQTIIGNKVAPMAAPYSSRGPSPNCPAVMKPDVMAPGSLVLASWIPNDSTATVGQNIELASEDFNLISGTSMSCPHASGVAALLKGAHPEWSHAAIRSAMMTTATTLDNTRKPIKDEGKNLSDASPLAMGAGHIVPNNALDPGLIYDASPQDYISLLCSMNFTKNQILTITRSNTYNCAAHPSLDLNYPSFIAFYNKNVTEVVTRTYQRVVTNVGGGAATYKVKVTAPKGSNVAVWPQTLVFGKKYEQQKYSMKITYPSNHDGKVSYGSIVWMGEIGGHTVRSPIVVTPSYSGK